MSLQFGVGQLSITRSVTLGIITSAVPSWSNLSKASSIKTSAHYSITNIGNLGAAVCPPQECKSQLPSMRRSRTEVHNVSSRGRFIALFAHISNAIEGHREVRVIRIARDLYIVNYFAFRAGKKGNTCPLLSHESCLPAMFPNQIIPNLSRATCRFDRILYHAVQPTMFCSILGACVAHPGITLAWWAVCASDP